MKTIKLNQLRASGEKYFRFPNRETVYIANHYDRATKKYSVSKAEDINHECFKRGDVLIEIGFTY